jgi:hypothetical protein
MGPKRRTQERTRAAAEVAAKDQARGAEWQGLLASPGFTLTSGFPWADGRHQFVHSSTQVMLCQRVVARSLLVAARRFGARGTFLSFSAIPIFGVHGSSLSLMGERPQPWKLAWGGRLGRGRS